MLVTLPLLLLTVLLKGAVTLDVVDVNCTDCLNATEIEDIYLLNTGDTATGTYTFSSGSVTVDNILLDANTIAATNDSGISIVDNANNGIFVEDGGNLGVGSTNPNALLSVGATNQFTVDSNGNITRIRDVTYSFPASQAGGANYVLVNDGAGNLTWNSVSGVGAVNGSGATGQVTFWNGTSSVTGEDEFFYDTSTNRLGLGTTVPSYTLDVVGDIRASGDLRVAGDDIFLTTNTSGFILVADGTNYNPVAVSGDINIASNGTTTIQPDAVALGTDTTGNYVATIADLGNSTITVVNGSAEGGAVTLDVVDVNCTDCLNATEIEDIYLLNTGDTATGTYTFSSGSVTVDNILLDANTIAATNDSGISIVDNANNGIFIQDGGNVGLGTTAPSYTLDVVGDIRASGDLRVAGDDIFLTTNTSGFILVADGTNYNPVAVSGDINIASNGTTTIQPDAVALGTDTTGNYVATIADAGNSTITVVNGSAEGGAVTLDVVDVNCTDCLNATEIEDIYLLNTGDTATGTYTFSSGSVTVDNILLDANTIAATNDSGISIVDNANNGIFVEDGGNLGVGSTNPNALLSVGATNQFTVDSNGNITRIRDVTYSFPASQAGGSNYVLVNDGAGNLTWNSVSGVGAVNGSGATGQVTFWNGTSSITGENEFFYDTSTNRLGLGTTAPSTTLQVVGNITISGGNDLFIGNIGLNDNGSGPTTSGASLIGTYDEFANSNSTNVQDVLDDFDAALGAGASKWTDIGTTTYLTQITHDLAVGGSEPTTGLYFDTSASALLINPYGTSTGNTGEIRFTELSASGTNYTGFKSPDSLSSNLIYTLPQTDGSDNYVLTTNGSGVLAWESVTGAGGLTGSAQTGMVTYWNGTNALTGEGDFYWDSANNRLGLGTSTPATTLHVVISDTNPATVSRALRLEHMATSTSQNGIGTELAFTAPDDSGKLEGAAAIQGILTDVTAATEQGALAFLVKENGTTLTERMRIISTGFVGIGTTLPSYRLDVAGDIRATGDLRIDGDDLYLSTNTSGYILVADGTNYNPVAVSGDINIAS
ncbi:MAG: hypothetical protein R3B92_01335, partial [Patescibacteria group bacterium]